MTTDTAEPPATPPAPESVLVEIAAMLRAVLDESGLEDIEITGDTRFHDDLQLESIDLVTLAGELQRHYGKRVNLAEFIADLGLEEVIALTVGELVEYVVQTLRTVEAS